MEINGKAIPQYTTILANQVSREQSSTKNQSNEKSIPLSEELVNQLFLQLGVIYNYTWTSIHTNRQEWNIAKAIWAKALTGISPKVIGKVLDELIASGNDFPPSLPVFVKMCKSHNGIPCENEAYNLMFSRNLDNPFIKLCYEKMNTWDLTHDNHEVLKKKFSEVYKKSLGELGNYPTNT